MTTLHDLDRIMDVLREMKRVKRDQSSEQKADINLLFLEILAEVVLSSLRISMGKYGGMTDFSNHISCFQITLDLYKATIATKCYIFPDKTQNAYIIYILSLYT